MAKFVIKRTMTEQFTVRAESAEEAIGKLHRGYKDKDCAVFASQSDLTCVQKTDDLRCGVFDDESRCSEIATRYSPELDQWVCENHAQAVAQKV